MVQSVNNLLITLLKKVGANFFIPTKLIIFNNSINNKPYQCNWYTTHDTMEEEEDTSIIGMFKTLYNRVRLDPVVFLVQVFTIVVLFGLLYVTLLVGEVLGL